MSQQGPHFSPHRTAKTNDICTFLWKNSIYGISDVEFTSVYSEKTRPKRLMMMKMMMIIIIIIIIMRKSQETTVFSGRRKLTMKLGPEKSW